MASENCIECGVSTARITRQRCRSCYGKGIYSGALLVLRAHCRRSVAERLSLYTDRSGGLTGCWEWLGWRDCCGYGRMTANGRRRGAHRVAFELEHGVSLGRDTVIRHSCDNPSCCNPAHLAIGTQADNVADRDARHRQARGERNGRAKLSASDVVGIRASVASGIPMNRMAVRYGIDPTTVKDIVMRKLWAHVQ